MGSITLNMNDTKNYVYNCILCISDFTLFFFCFKFFQYYYNIISNNCDDQFFFHFYKNQISFPINQYSVVHRLLINTLKMKSFLIVFIVAVGVCHATTTTYGERVYDQEAYRGYRAAADEVTTKSPMVASYHVPQYQHQQQVYAGPAQSYSYPSPAPKVKCPSSLLLSCGPAVAHVPCVAPPPSYHSAPAYGGSGSSHGGY
jgi:hypothetical protein